MVQIINNVCLNYVDANLKMFFYMCSETVSVCKKKKSSGVLIAEYGEVT